MGKSSLGRRVSQVVEKVDDSIPYHKANCNEYFVVCFDKVFLLDSPPLSHPSSLQHLHHPP